MILPIFAVRDALASVAFYYDVLEFSEMFRMPGESTPVAFAMMTRGEASSVGLSQADAPEPKGQGCVIMIYVAEDCDLDAFYARVRARGATITQEIRDEYWGDRAFMVSDPDGYQLQFCKTVRQMEASEIVEAAKP